jgi:hypothetical protein
MFVMLSDTASMHGNENVTLKRDAMSRLSVTFGVYHEWYRIRDLLWTAITLKRDIL